MITFFLMGLNLYPWSLSPPNCPSLGLALRTGRDSCWVQFRISPHQKICLSRKEWTRWLTAPQELCPHPRGPWKSYHSPRNHSQPDFNQRIQTLQLQHSTSLPIAPDWRTRIRGKIERWREQISIRLAPYDPLGILRSLVLYEGTSRPSLSFLRKLGFVHLVSATGIHLYALASFLEKMTYAGCVFFRIPLFTGLWISRVCSFTLCLSIWILCGARIGMLRPWLVILVRGLARYLGFQWRQFAPLFIALSIEAMIATYYWGTGHIGLAHSGRWIYALAVGGGLMGCEYLGLHLGLAVGSWAGVALWEMRESGILALGTPLLSLITLPVICNGTYPLLILSLGLQAMGLGSASSFILEWIARTLPPFITELTKWAMKTGNLWVVPTEALAAGALFSSLLFIWKPSSRASFRRPGTWIQRGGLLVSLILIRVLFDRITPLPPSPKAQSVEQLDVGQGDAALVSGTPSHSTHWGLIDSGSNSSLNDENWLEILATRRIFYLNWVALTHLDEDHAGGLLRLARLIPIHCAVAPNAELQTPQGKAYAHQLYTLGIQLQKWDSDCIPFPHFMTSHLPDRNRGNPNMGAIWIPLQSGGFYLSAGDAGEQAEALIGNWARPLSQGLFPRILKINHHGSRSSTSLTYLKTIQPTEAWISVGSRNTYGHPTSEVLQRLQTLGIPISRTDQSGALHTAKDPVSLRRRMSKFPYILRTLRRHLFW